MSDIASAAPVVLTVRQFGRRPIHVLLRDHVAFGRDCDGFLLADARASRRHAEFRLLGSAVVIEDLGSSNGTMLNGQQLHGPRELKVGDIVSIGNSEIVVGTAVAASSDLGTRRPKDLTTQMQSAEKPRSSIVRLTEMVSKPDLTATREVAIELAATAGSGDEGTFTIVFSDIENSTIKATTMGDSSWLQTLDVHNTIMREQLLNHGGREIKAQGDGFMMSFDSARRAVMFAIDAQRELARRRKSHPEWDLRVRLGIHTGEALRTADGDLFGRHVIVAARIADHAGGGEILVSSLVRELTAGKVDLQFDLGRTVELKGIGDQIVHRVSWAETAR